MIFLSIIVGYLAITFYYLLDEFRKLLNRGRIITFIEDVILVSVFAVWSYMYMLKKCGVVRGLNYILEILGALMAWWVIDYVNFRRYVHWHRKELRKVQDGIKEGSKKEEA